MIIDTERLLHVSSISSDKGLVEMELEEPFPEITDERDKRVILAVVFCGSLIIVIGTVKDYEVVSPDPDLLEQDVFARLTIEGHSVSISF